MARRKSNTPESIVREIKRNTRRKFSSEEKIRIVLEGLKGEYSIADICRRERIHTTQYYKWGKDFLKQVSVDSMAIPYEKQIPKKLVVCDLKMNP